MISSKDYQHNYYIKNKERIISRLKLHHSLNKDKISEYHKRYYIENKEKYLENGKKYVKNHPIETLLKDKRYRLNNPHRKWASSSISSHKDKGYSINITLDELEKLAKESKQCHYCGCEFDFGPKKNHTYTRNSASLDRKNNEKHIDIDNCQIICTKCNITKSDRTHKEFIDYCKKVIFLNNIN